MDEIETTIEPEIESERETVPQGCSCRKIASYYWTSPLALATIAYVSTKVLQAAVVVAKSRAKS